MYERQAILIKQTRKALGLTQAEFARQYLGVDGIGASQFVSNIERGRSPIPFTRLKFLRKAVRLVDIHNALIGDFRDGFKEYLK